MMKRSGLVMGGLFLFGGVLGFVPGVIRNGLYLGVFSVNSAHGLMHIASGLMFIAGALISEALTRWWFRIFGVFYGVLAIIGLRAGDALICGAISNNRNDACGHGVLALGMLVIGFSRRRTCEPRNPAADA